MVVSVCGGSVVGLGRVGEARVAAFGRRVLARLVGRLHRVHGIEVGRQVAVADEFRDAVHRRLGRVGGRP